MIDTIDSRSERDKEEWLIMVTADHAGGWEDRVGSNNFNHGDFTRSDRQIFLIIAGDKVVPGEIPTDSKVAVTHLDVYPTVMDFLDIEIKDEWDLDGRSRLR